MTLKSAQRFNFLDKETNVPIEIFENIRDSDIRNLAKTGIKDPLAALEQLKKTAEGLGEKLLDQIKELGPVKALREATRDVKGLFEKVMDLTMLDDKTLDYFLEDITTDFQTKKTMKQLIRDCRSSTAGYSGVGKPFKPTVACKSGSRRPLANGCDATEFAGHLHKKTNGAFKNTVKTPNKDLKNLIGTAGTGYNLGLCGVYSAVGRGMDKQVQAKGAAGLLYAMNDKRNSMAMMDIAGSSVGLQPKAYYPGVASDFLGNFQSPAGTRESQWSSMAQKALASAELLDNKWSSSLHDGVSSIRNMTGFSQDLTNVIDSARTNISFAKNQINDVVKQADTFVQGAYAISNKVNKTIDRVSSFGKKLSKWF